MKNPLAVCLLLLLNSLPLTTLAHGNAPTEINVQDAHISITPDQAERFGIHFATAAAGNIERHLRVYGRLAFPTSNQARVQARFPGIVRTLLVAEGDHVARNQELARIESNDSLQTYALRSPLEGRVIAVQISAGELTDSTPLFIIANDQQLWAELDIFPSQRPLVRPGLAVHINNRDHRYDSTLLRLFPSPDGGLWRARAELDNRDALLTAGDVVTAQIDVEATRVALRVDSRALQEINGETFAFVVAGNTFAVREVTTGRQDDHYTEILSGIEVGESYVTENSYLLKSDLGRSHAESGH